MAPSPDVSHVTANGGAVIWAKEFTLRGLDVSFEEGKRQVRLHNDGRSSDWLVGRDRDSAGEQDGLLEVQLVSGPNGCLARFTGDLIEETRGVVWGVEQVLLHDARVVLDLSGITSFDSRGLEAALRLMDAVRTFGGTLMIGDGSGSA
jgi:ABC-type transporter Mla MlaB component